MRLKIYSPINKDKKKIFLSFEGIKTEVQYFEGIIKNRDILNVNPNIEIILMLRNHTFLGWSNPLKAMQRTKFCIDNLSNNKRNVSSFISSIVEFCFYNSSHLSTKEDASFLYDDLIDLVKIQYNLSKNDNFDFTKSIAEDITDSVLTKINKEYDIKELDEFINSQFIPFNPKLDKVCLIVDRDRRSVNNKQYEMLVNSCQANNFSLYVSNPCFEFWLLLHFNEVFTLDRALLLDNKKLSSDDNPIHYCENELKKLLRDYEKNNICFNQLIDRISVAIENEKRYKESIDDLKNELGSNVGILVGQLLNNNQF